MPGHLGACRRIRAKHKVDRSRQMSGGCSRSPVYPFAIIPCFFGCSYRVLSASGRRQSSVVIALRIKMSIGTCIKLISRKPVFARLRCRCFGKTHPASVYKTLWAGPCRAASRMPAVDLDHYACYQTTLDVRW